MKRFSSQRFTEADLLAAGYRKFDNSSGSILNGSKCLYQKRIRDDRGTRYFIDLFLFDFRGWDNYPYQFSWQADFQFQVPEIGTVTGVVHLVDDTLESVEAKYAELFTRLKADHYEED